MTNQSTLNMTHVGLKIAVIIGFLAVFGLAWLAMWLIGIWLGNGGVDNVGSVQGVFDLMMSLQAFLTDNQRFWQWSRISGVLAYVALWLSVMAGLSISSQKSSFWFERGTAMSWHQFFSWLGIVGALLHTGLLLKDSYLQPTIWQLLIPFNLDNPQLPALAWLWAGVGQLAWYGMVAVAIGSLFKHRLAKTYWRYLHALALLLYVAVVAHGVGIGTDSRQLWLQGVYLVSNGALVLMAVVRILQLQGSAKPAKIAQNPV